MQLFLLEEIETKKVKRVFGTAISYVILILFIFLIIKAILPLLYNQTIDLVSNFPNIFSSILPSRINPGQLYSTSVPIGISEGISRIV